MSRNGSRVLRINTINKLAGGFEKHCSKLGGLVIETGEKISSKEILRAFEAVAEADAAVATARGSLTAALLDEQKTLEENQAIVSAVRTYARVMFAAKPDILSDFGIAPTRRHVRDTEERAQTLAKVRATRKARGTLGKKERAKIHGEPVDPATPPTPIAPAATPPTPIVPVTNGTATHGGA